LRNKDSTSEVQNKKQVIGIQKRNTRTYKKEEIEKKKVRHIYKYIDHERRHGGRGQGPEGVDDDLSLDALDGIDHDGHRPAVQLLETLGDRGTGPD